MLNAVAKRNVSFSNPSREDEALFQSCECWDLLFLLWQRPQREFMTLTICALSKLQNFSVSLSSILSFFKVNHLSYTPSKAPFFCPHYKAVVEALASSGIEVGGTQHIFFDPPFEILQNQTLDFGHAAERTIRFVEFMKEYHFPKGKEFCLMLRQYILHPNAFLFDLLKDVPSIGAEFTQELLFEALSSAPEPFDPEPIPKMGTRQRAIEITRKIQEAYQFSPREIFSLYLEVIRLVIRQQEAVIWKFAEVVSDLKAFCPAVQKKDVFFLLRYHPEAATFGPGHVAALAAMRDRWAKNDPELMRFVIDQPGYNLIVDKIEQLVLPLSKACPEERVANEFEQTLQFSLLSAFFPPFQPLMDQLRITDLTESGPRWGEPSWRGHLGQVKFILGEADIGIYLNWSLLKGKPVLFLSFFDIKKQEASSAFIPIDVPNEEITPNRTNFYGFILTVGSQVLRETAEHNVPLEAPEIPQSWIPAFTGLEETLGHYSPLVLKQGHVNRIWEFFQKMKLAYRNLFLCRVANRRPPEVANYAPEAVAAQGHIFPCHPRGALLPKGLFDIAAKTEFYIPDASEEFVAACRALFGHPSAYPEPLNLSLNMLGGNHGISYQVQTVDQLTGDIEHRRERNDTAPPVQMTQGHYVTLSANGVRIPLRYPPDALQSAPLFQRYFDYHNLLLKAALYYTASISKLGSPQGS
jgi:hypothetical protein